METLVSIVIPTYRRSDRIAAAVDSAVRQTYKNIEIIVVDDNAQHPEEREKTLNQLAKFQDIKIIKNRNNLGGAVSRNVGIKHASGEYVAFLDDDDEYYPEKIAKQLEVFESNPDDELALVFCNSPKKSYRPNILVQQMQRNLALTSTWLAKKSALEKIGGFEKAPCEQDTRTLLKLLASGYHAEPTQEALVKINPHSSDQGISGRKLSNIEGLKLLISQTREYYPLVDKKYVKNIEYSFSRRLLPLYIFNDMASEAKVEFKKMIRLRPFAPATVKAFLKLYFSKTFIYWKNRGQL